MLARLAQAARHYLLAVQFFTRIPITGRLAAWVGYSPTMLRASAAHFPGVGWLVAAVAMAVYGVLWWVLSGAPVIPLGFGAAAAAQPTVVPAALVAAVFSTIATALLTGGFHEDGLADVADGLGGTSGLASQRDRALEIMKDSRIGAFGAMALVLAVLAKITLLAFLGSHNLLPALAGLLGAHLLSRFCPLLLVRALRHVGDTAQSKSKPLADRISRSALAAAFIWCLIPLAAVFAVQGAIYLIVGTALAALAALYMGRLFAQRLQGFTGDCLGATQQVCEIAFYLGAAIAVAGVR